MLRTIVRYRSLLGLVSVVGLFGASGTVSDRVAGPAGAAFYVPPTPLPPGPPGSVVWARPLTGAGALPSAASNTLVLYRETTVDERDTVVSGAIALPKGSPPAEGWPVISWAHGTTGNAPDCAPTRGEEPNDEQRYLDAWVARGFAVVQTDYEGQGVIGTPVHPYFVGVAAARDATDIVRAARELDPAVGKRWFAFGHSEGGSAALFTAQIGPRWAPELQLLGAVSFAPGAHIAGFIAEMPQEHEATPALAFMLEMIEGVASVDRAIDLHALLTPAALARLPGLQQRCTDDLMSDDAWTSLPPAEVFKPGADLKPLERDLVRNESNRVTTAVPVLVMQGSADSIVPAEGTAVAADELCGNGVHLTYDAVPGKTHDNIVNDTLTTVERWTDSVLGGFVPPSTCGAPT